MITLADRQGQLFSPPTKITEPVSETTIKLVSSTKPNQGQ